MLDSLDHITMQRARGAVRMGFDVKGGRNRLVDLHQSGCLKAMLPRNHAAVPDAVLINTAGGLTDGDQLRAEVALDDGAALRLATQTAERIYKSTGGEANVELDFTLGAGCQFDWLAQETILFDGGRVARSITAWMDASASLMLVEPIVLGRLSMGEVVSSGSLRDHWRVYRDGDLIFADQTKLADFTALRAPAAWGDALSAVTALWVDPKAEDRVDHLRGLDLQGVEIGFSAWNGMLIMRALAQRPLDLKAALGKVVTEIRGRDLPRVWTM